MRRCVSFVIVIAVVLWTFGAEPRQALSEPGLAADKPAFAPGRILVKLEEGAPAKTLGSLNDKNDARTEDKLPRTGVNVVDLPADLSVAEAARRYETSPNVEYAEPDYLLYPSATPNDPRYPGQWALSNTGQSDGTIDSDIDAPEAWNVTTGSAETVVAVIDTGVDVSHPDLRDNVWTNPDEVAGNKKDDDGNGYVDDVNGWDFVHDDSTVYDAADGDQHGTHVSGTIAAAGNNGAGVTGVDWRAKVMPLKFIDGNNFGYVSDAAAALDYAVAEGVKISNNSYGYYDNCGGCYARTLEDAIERADAAGHLFVAAAMNGGADGVGDDNDTEAIYPANYPVDNIISVAASNRHDNLTAFSNYGATSVDLAAPGIDVLSTLPGGSYGYGYGTSMATPHVAGTAALVKNAFPSLDDAGIKAKIVGSVDRREKLEGKLASGGRLNVARALGVEVPPPPSTAPAILTPSPAKTHDPTPTISATVRDAQTNLVKTNVTLVYLDGRRIADFAYSKVSDKLTFAPDRNLPYGWHRVRVVVQDPQGLTGSRVWSFRVF